MSAKQVAWNRMFSSIGMKNTSDHYNEYANHYEEDCMKLGYTEPKVATDMLKQVMSNFEDENLQVLDVAAGTGLVADNLRALNFQGKIDGIDGSAKMLEKAKEKGNYRNLVEEFILPDKPLPYDDSSYDVVICLGSLSVPHVQPEAIKEFMRVTKCGGLIIFSVATTSRSAGYEKKLAEIAKSMEGSLQWENARTVKGAIFEVNYETKDPENTKTGTSFYLYKKL
uniref:Methyltransferase-like protein 27 n=1 Tax=Ciona intestinalis TaxID=7719 RepID=F6RNA2_CIOIN|nr:methyltransferase-like protein 27 [Ciona intestinalis]|eukprot:XP_002129333.1 methyltransferase-like protein 27 [Ciona intestinalis]